MNWRNLTQSARSVPSQHLSLFSPGTERVPLAGGPYNLLQCGKGGQSHAGTCLLPNSLSLKYSLSNMTYFGVACPETLLKQYLSWNNWYKIRHRYNSDNKIGIFSRCMEKNLHSSWENVTGTEINICSLSFLKSSIENPTQQFIVSS